MVKNNLLILESPNKAETFQEYLKDYPNWKIIATYGHFKNLEKNNIAISKKGDSYIGNFIIEKKNVYDNLKKAITNAQNIFIATDGDREGEAIAFDIINEFKLEKGTYKRVIFNEISREKIINVLINNNSDSTFDDIDQQLVNARYGRRLIDRIIGYKLSNLLKFILKRDEKAELKGIGRVSYAALSPLVKREKEINKYEPFSYRRIVATYIDGTKEFSCVSEKKYIEGEDDEYFFSDMTKLTTEKNIVTECDTEYVDYQPPKPITFSSLLANISYLYKFETEKTAKIAQKLFEGVTIRGKKTGLITYIRTDSYRISEDFFIKTSQMIPYIIINRNDGPIGYDYAREEQRTFKKSKNTQDAHEAIRPIYIEEEYAPHNIRKFLTKEEYLVYDYIYKITIASCMSNSLYISTKITVICDDIKLRYETKQQVFDGWEILAKNYVPFFKKWEKFDNNPPDLLINSEITPREITYWSRRAKTPERYSIGTFIEMLTSKGIGRPSTLPSILPEMTKKNYISIEKGIVRPTKTAEILYNWAEENASWIIDLNHAKMFEDSLEKIEKNEADKNEIIQEYDTLIDDLYKKFNFTNHEEYKNAPPTNEQIALLNKIKLENVEIPKEAFEKRIKAKSFLEKYYASKTICKCRICKKGEIINYDKFYKCSNKECDFILWKNKINKFLNNFSLEINENMFAEKILKNKTTLIEGLKGKNAIFNANVFLEYSQKYGYEIGLKIVRSK